MKRTGIVLAGGRSSRFGSNKAIYDFQGKTMLKHSVDLLRPFCEHILISGDKEEYYRYDYPCIPDKYGEIGPLGGIASCLDESDSEENIIVTCDMPLITSDLVAKLLVYHQPGKVTAFIDSHGRIYPFPLIIQKSHTSSLRRQIDERKYQIQELMDEVGFTPVLLKEEELLCLANVNSKDDLQKIEHGYSYKIKNECIKK